jgi:hypothetical protein
VPYFSYAVPHNNCFTHLLENISLYFTLIFSFFIPFYLFLHPMPYSIPSFLNVTVLHCITFTKAVYNQTSYWLLVG